MLTAVSSGSVLANVIPVVAPPTASKSGGTVGTRRQHSVARAVASRNGSCFRMGRGRQYSVKTFGSLAILLLCGAVACREKPIDQGALITARTVGLEHLQRGRLAEAEQEFRNVIALAPRDPLGYANLGLTYLRAGRYAEAESELDPARRLDPKNPDITLIGAELYSLTGRSAEARRVLAAVQADARVLYALAELDRQNGDSAYADRLRQVLARIPANLAVRLELADALLKLGQADSTIRYLEEARRLRPEPPREIRPYLERTLQALRTGRLTDARAALDRFLRLMEVTAPYQAALAEVDGIEGPLVGRPVLAFSPQSLITMRGITSDSASGPIHFTDVTGESGLPDLGAAVTALAWGDYDGDRENNLLVAAPEPRLYAVHGGFVADVSAKTPLPLPAGSVVATFADYDNDGYLDLLLVGGGSLAAYRNNLDGTFTLFPNADGIVQGGTDAAFADVDDDGRTDVFVTGATGSDGLFHNDGVRGFTRTADTIRGKGPVAMGDYDNDGAIDIFVAGSGLWHNNGSGRFTPVPRSPTLQATSAVFFDYDNDGWLDLIVTGPHGASLFHNDGSGRLADRSQLLPPALQRDSIGPLLIADIDGDGDQDIILGDRKGVHALRNDGGNAHLAMRVQLSAVGLGSGKNNSFGIGAKVEVRAGELYQTRVVTEPVTHFGLGSHFKADVLRVQWPNGVPQTIYFPGTDQDVLELQQLKGSCAFLYTWNGKNFEFITDMMWQSALGMPLGIMGNGEGGKGMGYAPAGASQEYIRIPSDALQPRDGRYVLQVTEELWETAYLDQLRLLAVDHPDSVEVFVDERFPPPPGPARLRLFQTVHRRPPLSAVDGRGSDVLDDLRGHDDRYVSNLTPLRYQGLTEPHELILDLDADAGRPGTFLFLRGWIYPADASINIAVSQQHKLRSELPALDVRDARGRWVPAHTSVGFPSGKNKTVVIDLAGLFPTRDHHLRLRTNLQIYWDQVFVADTGWGKGEGGRVTTLAPVSGDLHFRGFSRMYRRGGRYGPHWFEYDDVTKESPWRSITGAATRFGDVRQLLERSDDQYVVMVPGDEVTVEFDAPAQAPPLGWTRTFILYSDGWIKDSDLNTANGTTIGPLPYHAIKSYPYAPGDAYPADSARQRYLREYNTRIIKPSRPHGVLEER